jgi:hypothetical protein
MMPTRSTSRTDQEHTALLRQRAARGELALGEREREGHVDPHDLAGRAHLRTENDIDTRELGEREDGLLDGEGAR